MSDFNKCIAFIVKPNPEVKLKHRKFKLIASSVKIRMTYSFSKTEMNIYTKCKCKLLLSQSVCYNMANACTICNNYETLQQKLTTCTELKVNQS